MYSSPSVRRKTDAIYSTAGPVKINQTRVSIVSHQFRGRKYMNTCSFKKTVFYICGNKTMHAWIFNCQKNSK